MCARHACITAAGSFCLDGIKVALHVIADLFAHALGVNLAVLGAYFDCADTVKRSACADCAVHAVRPVDEAEIIDRCGYLNVFDRLVRETEVNSSTVACRLGEAGVVAVD